MPRETAAQRRAREYEESRIAHEKWQESKYRRVLLAIARAYELKFYVEVEATGIDCQNIRFLIDDGNSVACEYYTESLDEWEMFSIEENLRIAEEERDEKIRREELKQRVLARLTDEERDALGL